VQVTLITIDCTMTAVEVVAARDGARRSAMIAIVVYRLGSDAIHSTIYDELALLFEVVATYQMPVYVLGKFNVRFDRPDDSNTSQLLDLIQSLGFGVRTTAATQPDGRTIDAVITHQDTSGPLVRTDDVGLPDHHLLEWSVSTQRPSSVATPVAARPWRQLDIEKLRNALKTSPICRSNRWPDDVSAMADMSDVAIAILLDQLVPIRQYMFANRDRLTPGLIRNVAMPSD
jgi:hypothetical protein